MTITSNRIISKLQFLDEYRGYLSGIANFRNVLVHEYEKIDKGLVYSYLQKNIDQFADFKKQILKFVRNKG